MATSCARAVMRFSGANQRRKIRTRRMPRARRGRVRAVGSSGSRIVQLWWDEHTDTKIIVDSVRKDMEATTGIALWYPPAMPCPRPLASSLRTSKISQPNLRRGRGALGHFRLSVRAAALSAAKGQGQARRGCIAAAAAAAAPRRAEPAAAAAADQAEAIWQAAINEEEEQRRAARMRMSTVPVAAAGEKQCRRRSARRRPCSPRAR